MENIQISLFFSEPFFTKVLNKKYVLHAYTLYNFRDGAVRI